MKACCNIILYSLLLGVLFSNQHIAIAQDYSEYGKCSYYADKFHGRNSASGIPYSKYAYTAAHRSLPFGTILKVTNLANQKSVVVKVTDRGPVSKSLILDLSRAAAEDIGLIGVGITEVYICSTTDDVPSPKKTDVIGYGKSKNGKSSQKSDNKSSLLNNKTYDGDLNNCYPSGFGIQAGYYGDLENCLRDLKNHEEEFELPGFIHTVYVSGEHHYKLILGCVESKTDALGLLGKIRNNIPESFIVHFEEL